MSSTSKHLNAQIREQASEWLVCFSEGEVDAGAREAELVYRRAIANAFREVRDAIAAQSNARDALTAQGEREAMRLFYGKASSTARLVPRGTRFVAVSR